MAEQRDTPPTWTHSDSDGTAEMARALEVKSFRTKPDGSPMSTQDRVRLVRGGCVSRARCTRREHECPHFRKVNADPAKTAG